MCLRRLRSIIRGVIVRDSTMLTTILTATVSVGLFVLAAATGTPPPGPDLTGYAAVGTFILGAIAFIASIVRGRKNNAKIGELEDAADYVKEINSQHESLRGEIAQIRKEHKDERSQWIEEKSVLQSQLTELRKELQEQVIDNYKLREENRKLVGEIDRILKQLKQYVSTEEYEEFTKKV